MAGSVVSGGASRNISLREKRNFADFSPGFHKAFTGRAEGFPDEKATVRFLVRLDRLVL
jgi:hypothetical protein